MNGTVRNVLSAHRVFLIDNFGVLRNAQKNLPGVERTFAEIQSQGKAAVLLSNAANLSVQQLQDQLRDRSILLPEERIVTSGMALAPYFAQHGLAGKDILCLGNNVTVDYVRQAGGWVIDTFNILESLPHINVDAVVVGWYPVVPPTGGRLGLISIEIIDAAISVLKFRQHVRGVIANPDITAPYDENRIVFACGAIGRLIEECSGRILDRLGKPFGNIFELALSRFGGIAKEEIVMVGDSLDYDILGAKNFGIKSLLVLSGNTSLADLAKSELKPDFLAKTFTPEAALLDIP